MAVTGVRLFGVVSRPGENGAPVAPGTQTVSVRELAAVVRPAPYAAVQPTAEELSSFRGVIDEVFRGHTVLPAPFGAVFRSREHVAKWLDMHYIALIEAIHFVQSRCEGRVHIKRRADPPRELPGIELTAQAAEAFRLMRKQTVAGLPVRHAGEGQALLSAAFLIERERWEDFREFVADYQRRSDVLTFDLTGPWPPYDFVRLDLGT